MAHKFPVPLVLGSFISLLNHDWPPSLSTGHRRVGLTTLSPFEILFIEQANASMGYTFHSRKSPSLGITCGFHPNDNEANRGFYNAHMQVQLKNHAVQNAASGLTLQGYGNHLYTQAGVTSWGQWSLGYNSYQFNTFKQATNFNEAVFLQQAGSILNQAMNVGHPAKPETHFRMLNGRQNLDLKIKDHPDTWKTLADVNDKLVASLEICAHAGTTPKDQMALRSQFGL